jgi:hypothetical protein
MKKQFRILGLLLLAMAFVVSSCNKDDDDDNNNGNKTTTEYLTSGSWRITAMVLDPPLDLGNGLVITDLYQSPMLPQCAKDDYFTLHADGKVTFDEGPSKCDPADPQTTEGTWTLSDDEKTLTMKEPGEEDITMTISGVNDDTFTGTTTMEIDLGTGQPMMLTINVTAVKV